MRRVALVLAVIAYGSAAARPGPFRGKPVDLHLTAAPVEDVLRSLADAGKVNIVLAGLAPPPLDIKVKRTPWDKVLADIVARSKLASEQVGNLILIGAPELIAERKKAAKKKKRVYKGKPIDLDIKNAEAPAAAKLLAATTGMAIAIDGKGPRSATLRLNKVPGDQAAELLALHTATSLSTRSAPHPKPTSGSCVAETTQLVHLRLAGIGRNGTKGWALFIDATGGAHVATKGNCIGVGATMIEDIGPGSVSLDLGDSDTSAVIKPRP